MMGMKEKSERERESVLSLCVTMALFGVFSE